MPNQPSELTPRELEIATAYANGDTYRRIANRLYIAPATVRTHLATIYRKLGVSSKIELNTFLAGDKPARVHDNEERDMLISELALSLDEAIGRERALAEVLRIISRSRGQLSEVLESVLGYALELCDAEFGILFEFEEPGAYRAICQRGIPADFSKWLGEQGTFEVGEQTGLGRVAATNAVVNIPDVRSEAIYRSGDPLRFATAKLGGARSFAAIPMLGGDRLLGAFTVYRQTLRPFDQRTLAIASMFADQSAIAIENARLIERTQTLS